MLQRRKEFVVVALVQADGRLVEDIENAHQARADLGREADALALTAGERPRRARERQIAQADRLQKAEPRADLLENLRGDELLGGREPELVKKGDLLVDGERRHIVDGFAPYRDGQCLRPQALAVACRAGAGAQKLLDLLLARVALRLGKAPFEVVGHALERLIQNALAARLVIVHLELFALRAVEDDLPHLRGQLLHRCAQRELILLRERFKIHPADAVGADGVPSGGDDRPVEDGETVIRDDERGVGLELAAEPRTGRAGAVGVVEREHARRQLLDAHAAVVAGVVLRKREILSLAQKVHDHKPAREVRRRLDRVRQALGDVGADDQPVDDDLDVVLLVLLEVDVFREVIEVPVRAHTDIARSARVLEHLRVLALAPAHDGGQHLNPRPLREGENLVDDLVDRLLADLLAALGAVRRADARPEKAQIVIDLRHRAHGGARVARGRLLVDGDGGGESVDIVDVGLVHLAEEHARVARQALDVAALALGVDRVEREGGLAAAGETR